MPTVGVCNFSYNTRTITCTVQYLTQIPFLCVLISIPTVDYFVMVLKTKNHECGKKEKDTTECILLLPPKHTLSLSQTQGCKEQTCVLGRMILQLTNTECC